MTFERFPVAALDFYDDLEVDNTKAFWEEQRHVYDAAVKQPMVALMAELADEFVADGETAKIFRPFRDVRYVKDNHLATRTNHAVPAAGTRLAASAVRVATSE